MVLTLELPLRPQLVDVFRAYEQHFGALPEWLGELPRHEARALTRQALRRGAPLVWADY